MTDCSHDYFHLDQITRHFYGHIFVSIAKICDQCKAQLWDSQLDHKFQIWLNSLVVK